MKRFLKSINDYFNGPGATQRGDAVYHFITKSLTGLVISVIIIVGIGGLQFITSSLSVYHSATSGTHTTTDKIQLPLSA